MPRNGLVVLDSYKVETEGQTNNSNNGKDAPKATVKSKDHVEEFKDDTEEVETSELETDRFEGETINLNASLNGKKVAPDNDSCRRRKKAWQSHSLKRAASKLLWNPEIQETVRLDIITQNWY